MGFSDRIEATDRAAQTHLGGVAVTYTPDGGVATSLNPDGDPIVGIFDERYAVSDPGGAGVEVIVPAVSLRLSDLPADPAEDDPTITIEGVDYTVRARETDGSIGGSVRLLLRRVPV